VRHASARRIALHDTPGLHAGREFKDVAADRVSTEIVAVAVSSVPTLRGFWKWSEDSFAYMCAVSRERDESSTFGAEGFLASLERRDTDCACPDFFPDPTG